VIQPNLSTVSAARVFTSAWTEFCGTSAGRQEYWRRFGDHLFTDREFPSEFFSQLPPGFREKRRRRQRSPRPPDGLRTPAEAAAKLGCSIKTP
jgi:hypothetical protein